MQILQFGETGQLAREMGELCRQRANCSIKTLSREDVDLSDPSAIVDAIASNDADVVVNAAAFTAVDAAETEEDLATRVNAAAPSAMAQTSAEKQLPFIHISTDYVFNGEATRPYKEDDVTNPQTAYGRTKLAGEAGVIAAGGRFALLRTAWVYSPYGKNFVKTMLRLASDRDVVRVVDDQYGCPTSARDIASTVLSVAAQLSAAPGEDAGERHGVFHYAGEGRASWADFAEAIFREAGLATQVERIPSEAYPTPAQRPKNSQLNCAKIERVFGIKPRPWRDSLRETVAALRAD